MPDSRLAVELEISAKQCKESYQQALSKLSKTANLPGFRKGKVPQAVLLQQVGAKRIQASAIEKLLEVVWPQALQQESIEPLCEPELIGGFEALLENFNPDSKLTLTLETDISPIPQLKSSKGLTVEAEKVVFDPKKIDELIEQSRKQLSTLIPVENRPAKKGDVAVVSFEGKFTDNNSPIEGGNSDSMDIELEKGQMIPGFVEGIIGMNINDEKTVECTFPKDYPQEDARNRKAKFDIKVKDLKTRELPKLDDDFAKQASDKDSLEELRKELEAKLKEDAHQRSIKNRQEALLKALVEQLEIDLPKTLIEIETRNLIEQTARNFAQQGIDVKSTFTPELINKLMDSSRPEAIENLRRQFAMQALRKEEGIEVPDKEVDKKFEEVKKELSKEKNIDFEKLKEAVLEDLLQDKVFTWLEENNTVIETLPKTKSLNGKPSTQGKTSQSKSKKTKTKVEKTTK